MDHKQAIAALQPEQRRSLLRKSDPAGLAHLAAYMGVLGATSWAIFARVEPWPLLMLPQGVLIVFLFTLHHETSHLTAFRSPWLNKVVGAVTGFLVLTPPEWFRHFHFDHHRHTQNPEKDPELASPKPDTLAGYLLHISGLPLWRAQGLQLLRNASFADAGPFVPPAALGAVRREARAMLAAYAALIGLSVYLESAALVFLWLIPALIGQPFLRLYLLAEHGHCPQTGNMLENSRTTATNGLVRALAWNMPYHVEHHAYPSVPFFRLPELHELLKPHAPPPTEGYIRFHRDYLARLRHN